MTEGPGAPAKERLDRPFRLPRAARSGRGEQRLVDFHSKGMDARSSSAVSGGAASLDSRLPWDAAARARRTLRARYGDWLEREAFLLPFVAVYVFLLVRGLPSLVSQDSWFTLLGGREIWQHGLPAKDTLAILTQGAAWVDQQWFAQTLAYGLFKAGGLELTLLVHVAVLTLSFCLALWLARRQGVSGRRIGVVAALSLFVIAPSTSFRAQSFVYPLFVAVLWLLIADARRPSRRVFLTLPLLVLWANMHGSAVLGASLVALCGIAFGAGQIRQRAGVGRWLPRSSALVALPALALFASPYGFSLFGYYKRTIANSSFSVFVPEWRSATFPAEWPFFLLAVIALLLVGRYGRRLTLFEQLTLLVTLAGGLLAVRNGPWFGFAALAILPITVEEAWPIKATETRRHRMSLVLAFSSLGVLLVAVAAAATRPASWLERDWPSDQVAGQIASVAEGDPGAPILADSRYGDWLLWQRPELAGRIAYDIRFELLSSKQIEQIAHFQSQLGVGWKTLAEGYRVIVFDSRGEDALARALLRERGARALYRDARATVILRPAAART